MKKITIAIIICAAVFVFFGALSAWALSTHDFSKDTGRGWRFGNFLGWWANWDNNRGSFETRSIDKTLAADGIDFASVNVSSVSSDITVTEGDRITARLYGEYASRGEIDLVMTEIGGNLVFKVEYPNNLEIRYSNLRLDVTIPAAYVGELDLDTVSGQISTTLGNSFTRFSADTTSGDVRCGDITAGSVRFSTVSGDIIADSLAVENKVGCDTTSGGLEIGMLTGGGLDADTVSGDIRVNTDASGAMDIDTTSGSVKIGVPADAKIYVDFQTVSGDFTSGMPLTYESSDRDSFKGYTDKGGAEIRVSTVSGSFSLNAIN